VCPHICVIAVTSEMLVTVYTKLWGVTSQTTASSIFRVFCRYSETSAPVVPILGIRHGQLLTLPPLRLYYFQIIYKIRFVPHRKHITSPLTKTDQLTLSRETAVYCVQLVEALCTSRKVAGLIPYEVIGFFNVYKIKKLKKRPRSNKGL
jgi:hypothetical protein